MKRRLLLLIIVLGITASFMACGATTRTNSKIEKLGMGDSSQSQVQTASADQPDWWLYDTPFGY
ncbi:MAG: hypothetical protein C4520_05205 [Candidatus Abyssobacteria bacterium SURF_5]|uniref:Uncharacterized protein n=1 Tax=Abyssobacteria bacterium (strain SURF_5) TaxID=2093360 RepID=A0A3A4NY00_ABYX5|nr:MAG: hypothetical protein C4520_05205 [Candidatus Abyssubacteria bacterium SURF_5]